MGAACAWRTPSGWTGRRFHLGSNKEVFDAEAYSIRQALSIMNPRQESGRRHTLFVDSTSAISRVRSGDIGPGQRFVVESVEVATRILTRNNEVTIRWVPAHYEASGNGGADEFAKAVAEGGCPEDAAPGKGIRRKFLRKIPEPVASGY